MTYTKKHTVAGFLKTPLYRKLEEAECKARVKFDEHNAQFFAQETVEGCFKKSARQELDNIKKATKRSLFCFVYPGIVLNEATKAAPDICEQFRLCAASSAAVCKTALIAYPFVWVSLFTVTALFVDAVVKAQIKERKLKKGVQSVVLDEKTYNNHLVPAIKRRVLSLRLKTVIENSRVSCG